VAVTGYRLYRCTGAGCTSFGPIASPNASPYTDSDAITASTTYRYRIEALDAAGNASALSAIASVTTPAGTGPAPDTTPPTAPTNLVAAEQGDARIDLTWTASTDNVAVAGYRIERCTGVSCNNFSEIASPVGTTYSDTTSLVPLTTYRYRIRAVDSAGNFSTYVSFLNVTTAAASGGTLPLGALAHDGPATPEQISLFLPVTGALPQTATATVRYKPSSSSIWINGHPLYRIRPDLTETPSVGSVPDAFAWPIIGLQPGTSYDVEVSVNSGATTVVRTLTHTTRALPPAAGAPTKTANSAGAIATQIAGLVAGDVLEIANGTYNVSGLQLNRSGTSGQPIYIRGASRAGVVLRNPGRVLQILDASNVVIENMTMEGSGIDSGVNASSVGIEFFDGTPNQTRITVRNVTIRGVDRGIGANEQISEFLAYDNTLDGNNTWITSLIDTNATWNDDGIIVPGFGNAVFNNSLRGFGDSLSFASHVGGTGLTQAIGNHFYRNEIRNSGDDLVEVDYGHRNLSFYDNRGHNSMTFLSLDPIYGGPLLAARNISINTGRTPFKWNSRNSGQFVYNNTIVSTTKKYANDEPAAESGWYQANNGDQNSFGYRNNLLVYRGSGAYTIRLDNTGYSLIDFTHNSWYPDLFFQWPPARFDNLNAAFNGLAVSTPLFSGASKRHTQDNITVSNPWTATVTLGADYHTEVVDTYLPTLSAGTSPKNSGAVIFGVTDGFSGGAPDRGAVIEGRPVVAYGDRGP
jgi:chitodextrinase